MIATMQNLTEKEEQFLALLERVNDSSIWGVAISNVLNNPQPWKVRDLICELKSQAYDGVDVMKDILGEEAFNQLLEL